MTKKEFYSKLKYKNVAFGLACSLLAILAIGSACDIKPEKAQPETTASEPEVEEKPAEPEDTIPDKNTYTRGKAATDSSI